MLSAFFLLLCGFSGLLCLMSIYITLQELWGRWRKVRTEGTNFDFGSFWIYPAGCLIFFGLTVLFAALS